jgi:hypothetical protein
MAKKRKCRYGVNKIKGTCLKHKRTGLSGSRHRRKRR